MGVFLGFIFIILGIPIGVIIIAISRGKKDSGKVVNIKDASLTDEQKKALDLYAKPKHNSNTDKNIEMDKTYSYLASDFAHGFDKDSEKDMDLDEDMEDYDNIEDDDNMEDDFLDIFSSKKNSSPKTPKKSSIWPDILEYNKKSYERDFHDALMGDGVSGDFMDEMYGPDNWF